MTVYSVQLQQGSLEILPGESASVAVLIADAVMTTVVRQIQASLVSAIRWDSDAGEFLWCTSGIYYQLLDGSPIVPILSSPAVPFGSQSQTEEWQGRIVLPPGEGAIGVFANDPMFALVEPATVTYGMWGYRLTP